MNRRDFLKGLLSSIAAGALIKNGIVQPGQVIAKPERTVFDMAANTWRQNHNWFFLGGALKNQLISDVYFAHGGRMLSTGWEWSGTVTYMPNADGWKQSVKAFGEKSPVNLKARVGSKTFEVDCHIVSISHEGDVCSVELAGPIVEF